MFLIEGKKRILLNDPDVVAERMNRFEQTVAQLKADNLQLEQRLQQNTHHIQTLQSSLQSMYSKTVAFHFIARDVTRLTAPRDLVGFLLLDL